MCVRGDLGGIDINIGPMNKLTLPRIFLSLVGK